MSSRRVKYSTTAQIIERLNKDKIKVVSISKGIYPKELIDKGKYGADNEYGSTIVSLSDTFRKKYKPYASPISDRINELRKLHDNGLKTWVSMEPYPTPNIVKQDINEVLEAVSFVDKIVFGKWNYNKLIGYFNNETAKEVLSFCGKKGIGVHIKDGTITSNDKPDTREMIFYPPRQKALFEISASPN